MQGTSQEKHALCQKLLELGMVLVVVDARRAGVRVPRQLQDDATLRLNLSHRFGLPLEASATGLCATLTFGGEPFDCVLPWDSIYVLFSHVEQQPYIFTVDIPADVVARIGEARQALNPRDVAERAPGETSPPVLTLVADTVDEADNVESHDAVPPPPADVGRRRGHLRVIK